MSTQNGCSSATFLIETESRNTYANSEQNMVVMASENGSGNRFLSRVRSAAKRECQP